MKIKSLDLMVLLLIVYRAQRIVTKSKNQHFNPRVLVPLRRERACFSGILSKKGGRVLQFLVPCMKLNAPCFLWYSVYNGVA